GDDSQALLATLDQVKHDDPVPPRGLQPKVPRDLETVCLKCLQKEPRQRYGSAADLAEDLRRFLAGGAIRARPLGVWGRGVKWAKRRPALAAMLTVSIAAALSLLGGGVWFTAQLRVERDNAERARAHAVAARDKAQAAEEARRRALYISDMQLAS